MAQSFVAGEEIGLARPNGPAEIAAELIPFQSRLRVWQAVQCRWIEKVSCIQPVVTQKFVRFSVELLRAGARGDIDDRARVPAEFRAVCGVVDLEFGHGIDRGLESDLILQHVTQVYAIDHEVDGVLASTSTVKGQCPLSADRDSQKAICRTRHRSRDQLRQIDEVPAVQRNLLHNVLINHLSDGHGR